MPYGIVGSTYQLGRFNRITANTTIFPNTVVSQLVGHLLGDGFLAMTHTSKTPCFVFTQTLKRFEYVWHVYQKLAHYCNRMPLLNLGLRKGINYPFLQVISRSYPFMFNLFSLFYEPIKDANSGKVKWTKKIDPALVTYLDSVALAYWAMDDGAKASTGFYLHTKRFTYNETYLLVSMLHYNFKLECTVQNHDGMPVIYIKAQSMRLFRSLVTPHFCESMMYKLA